MTIELLLALAITLPVAASIAHDEWKARQRRRGPYCQCPKCLAWNERLAAEDAA